MSQKVKIHNAIQIFFFFCYFQICERLENDGQKLETEITGLQSEMNNLQKILTDHKCMAVPPRIKPEREYFMSDKYDNRMVST